MYIYLYIYLYILVIYIYNPVVELSTRRFCAQPYRFIDLLILSADYCCLITFCIGILHIYHVPLRFHLDFDAICDLFVLWRGI